MKLRGKVTIYAEQKIPDDVWNSMTSEEQEEAASNLHLFLRLGADNFNYGGNPDDDERYYIWYDED